MTRRGQHTSSPPAASKDTQSLSPAAGGAVDAAGCCCWVRSRGGMFAGLASAVAANGDAPAMAPVS